MTFEATMRAAGLMPGEVAPDGRWRRCKTADKPAHKNGAYILYPDGRGYWRNWATDAGLNEWRDSGYSKASPMDQAKLDAIRKRERDERIAAIKKARAIWNESTPYRLHAYITDKNLGAEGCAGLRLWNGAVRFDRETRVDGQWLVVPIMYRGALVNVQRIHTTGKKAFVRRAPVKGGFYVIDRPRAALTVFVEGLATGLAVFQCVKHARVVVAYDAGNLLHAIQAFKPTGMACIAADNDWATAIKPHMNGVNPGIEKARNAASLIDCGVAYPEGIGGSDWADWLKEFGPAHAKRMERLIQAQARYVVATG